MKLKIGQYKIDISNENKIFFPESKITKFDLIEYYSRISQFMIKHIQDRPIMMHRFPNGIKEKSFYQKNASEYFPKWIKTFEVPKEDGTTNYVLCQNEATLIYLVNQAMIVPHIWLSKYDKPYYPDKLVFDLDPSVENFKALVKVALGFKKLMENLGLVPFIMTTGSQGLHVVVPIIRSIPFDVAKEFMRNCAEFMRNKYPDLLTLELRKDKRGNKIFIDILRNEFTATSVAPYAVRAHPKAPIARPIYWDQLDKITSSQYYNINNIFNNLDEDPWQDFFKKRKSPKTAILKLSKIMRL